MVNCTACLDTGYDIIDGLPCQLCDAWDNIKGDDDGHEED